MKNGMRRTSGVSLLGLSALLSIAFSACGDPFIVLGDTPGAVRDILGVGDSAGTRVDSLAVRTKLLNPTAAAFNDANSTLYVADRGASTASGGAITPVIRLFRVTTAGRSSLIYDGACTPVCVREATDMIISTDGALLIADALTHRILRFDVDTRTFTVVAGTGASTAATSGSPASSTPIDGPSGLALDEGGLLYVSERNAGRVFRIDASGNWQIVAGGGTAAAGNTPIEATSVSLVRPAGLALHNGTLYIADQGANKIYAVNLAARTIRLVAGSGLQGFTGDGGPAAHARFDSPFDVAVAASGSTLFVVDTGNDRVRTVHIETEIANTYMGTGQTTYNGERLAAGATSLRFPVNLVASSSGFVFVVDRGHSVIRRVATTF